MVRSLATTTGASALACTTTGWTNSFMLLAIEGSVVTWMTIQSFRRTVEPAE
jgi:hypothetical protein